MPDNHVRQAKLGDVDEFTRWEDRNIFVPQRNGVTTSQGWPQSFFEFVPVFTVAQAVNGDTDTLTITPMFAGPAVDVAAPTDGAGLGTDVPVGTTYRFQEVKPGDPNTRYYSDGADRIEVTEINDDDPVATARILLADGTSIAPAHSYEPLPQDAVSWDGTFEKDERRGWDAWLFQGHDLCYTDPKNLQDSNAIRNFVFAFPAPKSKDYYKATLGKSVSVAHGAVYIGGESAYQTTEDHSATSEFEYQVNFSAGVSAKASVELIGSFSMSESFRAGISHDVTNSSGSTISFGTYFHHSLVLDLPRVQLDAGFIERVNELCLALDKPDLDEEMAEFVKSFGTHFAHSVTYGGMTTTEHFFSSHAATTTLSAGLSLSAGAEVAEIGGGSVEMKVDASGKWRHEDESGTTTFHAIGGNASSNGGFTLGDDAVPIFTDLRDLSLLLDPVLLPDLDPDEVLRCQTELASYLVRRAQAFPAFDTSSLLPLPVLEVQVTKVRKLDHVLSRLDSLVIEVVPTDPGNVTLMKGDQSAWTLGSNGTTPQSNTAVDNAMRYVVKDASKPCSFDVHVTVTGKWRDPSDRDLKSFVADTIQLSDFSTATTTRSASVSRDMGSFKIEMAITNRGRDISS